MADEAAPANFDAALAELAAELARMSPVERQETLDRARVRPGQLPYMPPLPPAAPAEARNALASSPMDYFRQEGARMAGMTPEDRVREFGRTAQLGAELTGVPGLVRAGGAVGNALADPSIPNATNAGVQTGLALMRPGVALGSLGAGYGAALADDLGMFDTSAQAEAPLTRRQQREMEMQRRTREQEAAIARQAAETKAKLDQQGEEARQKRELDAEGIRQQREVYDRQVETAEAARDRELARDKRFADTSVGKVYEATAGVTPFLAAAGLGALTRAPMKATPFSNYGLPIGLGALEGGIAANVPLGTDAYLLPPASNPQRAAYEAYARELPPDHPRRQEWMDYAARLDKDNPVRTEASKEFYNPMKLAERTGAGIAEGVTGGVAGAKAVSLVEKGANALGSAARGLIGRPGQGSPASSAAGAGTLPGELPATLSTPGPASVARNALAGPETSQRQLPSPEALPSQSASEARIIVKSRGKDGITRFHGDKGHFTSDPRKSVDE